MGHTCLRVLVCAAVAGGCYGPITAEGLPCSRQGECPDSQQCEAATNRCVRMLSTPDAPPRDAAPDAPADAVAGVFFDDFERADDLAIGNGWIEKTGVAFALAGGVATKALTNTTDYRDNLVYRPAGEDLLDVEISVDVRFTADPPGYAQIFVRTQQATIGVPDAYDGYILYLQGTQNNEAVLGRQHGTVFVVPLSRFPLSPPINTTDRYRLTLSARGTQPVRLVARVESLTGGAWSTIGEAMAADSDGARIATPGTVGFSGSDEASYTYDDFRRIAVAP